jgi:hypothetical protein
MLPDTDYSLVVDLGALKYSDFEHAATYSQDGSPAFRRFVADNLDLHSVPIEVLVQPDERFFSPQDPLEQDKKLSVSFDKIRKSSNDGFKMPQDPFFTLRADGDMAPFDYGYQSFLVHTKPIADTSLKFVKAPVAISIWANGRPVDEISVALCIVVDPTAKCSADAISSPESLSGVDLSGRGIRPDAALQIIDRGTSLVGVYRCNACGGDGGGFVVWRVDQPSKWLADRVKEIQTDVTAPIDPNASVTRTQLFEQGGDNLFNVVFSALDGTTAAARTEFAKFVATSAARTSGPPSTLFVRLMPRVPGLTLAPLGLMRVPLAGGKVFLGQYLDIQTPLEYQDYSADSQCVKSWQLFVPPDPKTFSTTDPDTDPVPTTLRDVELARSEFSDWISAFHDSCPSCVVSKESDFASWLGASEPAGSWGVIMLSHHFANRLYFFDGGNPAVSASSIARAFARPSIVIFGACGTAEPGASEFIRNFNSHGVGAALATSTEVESKLAGRFLKTLMDLLAAAAQSGDGTYTIGRARFDATIQLSKKADDNGELYGPRAFAFILVGNSSIHACIPAKGTSH